jgi:hypothetical protein
MHLRYSAACTNGRAHCYRRPVRRGCKPVPETVALSERNGFDIIDARFFAMSARTLAWARRAHVPTSCALIAGYYGGESGWPQSHCAIEIPKPFLRRVIASASLDTRL